MYPTKRQTSIVGTSLGKANSNKKKEEFIIQSIP